MSFNKNRNSRDDKSGRGDQKPSKFGKSEKPGSSTGERRGSSSKKFDSSEKPARGYSKDENRENNRFGKKFGSDREAPSFRKKDQRDGQEDSRRKSSSFSRDEKPSFEKRRNSEKTFASSDEDKNVKLRSRKNQAPKKESETIRLNRYIANSGVCSRRKADELIASGVISVNGEVVSELGAKVNPAKDQVRYNGELLKREKMVYVLLNKPKDFITTTDDPQERKTVMELVKTASSERIYPVGRLDRNTTGLLLMTNDGDLAEKLSHPRNNVTKIYNVELSRNLTQGDFNKIAFGLELEDGFIKPDSVSYVTGASKKEVGIQIHSGKNRIVRRIFESLGYEVEKLDRVIYANLSKKDLPRGKWRYLSDQEVINLKHFIK